MVSRMEGGEGIEEEATKLIEQAYASKQFCAANPCFHKKIFCARIDRAEACSRSSFRWKRAEGPALTPQDVHPTSALLPPSTPAAATKADERHPEPPAAEASSPARADARPGRRAPTALLVLADGTVIEGRGAGAIGHAVGEVCFNTAMTGYQEILTDPSYAGQIVTFTFPHIGNVGTNDEDIETANLAARPACAAACCARRSRRRPIIAPRRISTRG